LSWRARERRRSSFSQEGLQESCVPSAISARARVTSCRLSQTGHW
jgi:hypothetical protein